MQHKLIERTVPWMKQAEPFILIIDIGPGCSVCPSSARRYSVAFAVHLVFIFLLLFRRIARIVVLLQRWHISLKEQLNWYRIAIIIGRHTVYMNFIRMVVIHCKDDPGSNLDMIPENRKLTRKCEKSVML